MSADETTKPREVKLRTAGFLAQYEDPASIMHAAERVRDAGYTKWDVHTPFPVHGMDDAMGMKPTPMGWISLSGGLTGGTLALLLQWYTNGYDYPLNIGGKPAFAIQTFIPITFELTVLLTAFATLFGMLGLNRLPTLYHWVFNSRKFERATDDRFFLSIDVEDPKFHKERTKLLLERTKPLSLEEVEEAEDESGGAFRDDVNLTIEAIAGISSPLGRPGEQNKLEAERHESALVADADKTARQVAVDKVEKAERADDPPPSAKLPAEKTHFDAVEPDTTSKAQQRAVADEPGLEGPVKGAHETIDAETKDASAKKPSDAPKEPTEK